MFNEREALKVRLEQLVIMEEKTLKIFKEERNEIFNRLRELDNSSSDKLVNNEVIRKLGEYKYPLNMSENQSRFQNIEFKELKCGGDKYIEREKVLKRKKRSNKTLKLREVAIEILKKQSNALPLKQLKKEIETETGIEISNISLFMTTLVREEENIKKATHGQYMYVNN